MRNLQLHHRPSARIAMQKLLFKSSHPRVPSRSVVQILRHRPFSTKAVFPNTLTTSRIQGDPDNGRQDSVMGERVASQKFGGMVHFVQKLPTISSPTQTGLRSAFLYWLSKPTRRVASKRNLPELPLNFAQKILDYCVDQNDPALIEYVVDNPGVSCNGGFDRLIYLYLEPLQGTGAQLRGHKYRKSLERSPEQTIDMLAKASAVRALADRLHRDPRYPNIVPDLTTCESTLYLWSKRSQFLANNNPSWRDSVAQSKADLAFGGKSNSQECIDAMKEFVFQRKQSIHGPQPDTVMYSILLTAISQGKHFDAADEAFSLLKELELDDSVKKTIHLYTAVLLAYRSEVTRSTRAQEKAIELWNHMISMDDPTISRNPIAAGIMMSMFAKVGKAEEAQKLLDEMEASAKEKSEYPTRIHYNTLLHALTKAQLDDATIRAEKILQRMESLAINNLRDTFPDRISYTSALNVFLQNGGTDCIEKAEAVLDNLEESSGRNLRPDKMTYSRFMQSLSMRRGREVDTQIKESFCIKIEEVLQRWRRRSESDVTVKPPDLEAYKLCLHAWATSYSTLSPERGMLLFNEIESRYQAGQRNLRPDVYTFESVLHCLSIKVDEASVRLSESLLRKLDEYNISQTGCMVKYYIGLVARQNVQKAATILNELEDNFASGASSLRPNEQIYNAVIRGFCVREDGALEAQRLLDRMKRLALLPGRTDMTPSAVVYSSLIEAWAKSGRKDAVDHIEALFAEVCDRMIPNHFVYATYQNAISRSNLPDAPERVEAILTKMQEDYEQGRNKLGRPDANNFAAVISCWSFSRHKEAAERAEAILNRMESLYLHSLKYAHLRPTARCFKGAIAAWAMSGHPDGGKRALVLLDRMSIASRGQNIVHLRPSRACYDYCIVAIGRSKDSNRARKSLDLLKRMQRDVREGYRHSQPGISTMENILEVCNTYAHALANEREESLEVAEKAIDLFAEADGEVRDMVNVYTRYVWVLRQLVQTCEKRDEVVHNVRKKWPEHILSASDVNKALHNFETSELPTELKSVED
jgi:hypothetical protein